MTNQEFYTHYLTEEQCVNHFKAVREHEGIHCKKCDSTAHYWLSAKKQFQRKTFKFRTGIKQGTLLESSNLPLRKWYEALHLVTMSKNQFQQKH